MFFGFRLPGPFRIGMSSRGRVYGGVRVGPVSVSKQIYSPRSKRKARPDVWPVSLDEAAAQAQADGWTVTGSDPDAVRLRKGGQAAEARAVPGGVTVRRVTSRRAVILWIVLGTVIVCLGGLCGLGALLDGTEPASDVVPESSPSATRTTAAATTAPAASPTPAAASPTPAAPARTTAAVPPPAPQLDKRYATCKEAIAAGLGPYVKGQDPEYAWYRDSDGDGVVCER